MQQYSHGKTAFLKGTKHNNAYEYLMTGSLTLYSVAVSMPLMKVTSPSSNAIQRFKCRKCCGWSKACFLYTCNYSKFEVEKTKYLSTISAAIVNKKQAIDIPHPM